MDKSSKIADHLSNPTGFVSSSQTVHLFMCFAPEFALLGFLIEISFPHNLYDFSYNLMPRLGIELTSESCTSLSALKSGRNTADWATETAAIKSNSEENKFAPKYLSGLGCLLLYRWQQQNKCRILKQKCLKTLVLKIFEKLVREREKEILHLQENKFQTKRVRNIFWKSFAVGSCFITRCFGAAQFILSSLQPFSN